MNTQQEYRPCHICSYCQNCVEDENGRPTCKNEPGLDCSDLGEMKDWGFSSDGECDCAEFDPREINDCEPEDDEDYFYNGEYDYCPSVFDRI